MEAVRVCAQAIVFVPRTGTHECMGILDGSLSFNTQSQRPFWWSDSPHFRAGTNIRTRIQLSSGREPTRDGHKPKGIHSFDECCAVGSIPCVLQRFRRMRVDGHQRILTNTRSMLMRTMTNVEMESRWRRHQRQYDTHTHTREISTRFRRGEPYMQSVGHLSVCSTTTNDWGRWALNVYFISFVTVVKVYRKRSTD